MHDTDDRLSFATLRRINLERCGHWHPTGLTEWSLSDWAVAFMGEAGEALNVVKKLKRDGDAVTGNDDTRDELIAKLGEELADTIIYADLLAARAGIDLGRAVVEKFNKKSVELGFRERL